MINLKLLNVTLAKTGAIRETKTEKLYRELGLESLQNRRMLRRLCSFYKIYRDHIPPYLHNLILRKVKILIPLRTTKEITLFRVKH